MKEMEEKLDVILDGIEKILSTLVTHDPSPWMTTSEAARYLRCSESKLEELTNAGLLPHRRLDPRSSRSRRLYHRNDLAAYLVTGRNPHSSPLRAHERRIVKELS